MKILHVSPSFPYPPNDGGKIVIYSFYVQSRRLGHEVTFLSLSKVPVSEQDKTSFDPNRYPEVIYDKGISSLLRLPRALSRCKSYLVDKFYNTEFYHLLKKTYVSGNYDIVHFEGLHLSPYALRLQEETGAASAVRLHNIESMIMRRFRKQAGNPFMKLFFFYEEKQMIRLEQKVFAKIKNIIFISRDDMRLSGIDNYPCANPFVSPAGVEAAPCANATDGNPFEMLFVGSMDWKPNEEAVLWFVNEIYRPLKREYPQLKLTIVGKNPSKSVRELSSPGIEVTGLVPSVEPFIRRSGICIIPIRVGGGMRIKILEQMLYGKAIISTTVGAEGIEYSNGKNILIADSPEDFRMAITGLLRDEHRRLELGREAKRFVIQNHDWEKIVSDLLEYYRKVIPDAHVK